MNSSNVAAVLNLIVKQLKIPVTRQSIKDELQKHPGGYSLLTVSDTLDNWSIPNAAYQVTFKELLKAKIPLPFIACFRAAELTLVKQLNDKQVTLSNDRYNNHQLSADEFIKHFQGTILVFQKDTLSGEPDYPAKRRKEVIESMRIPFAVAGFALILILLLLLNQSYLSVFNWHTGLLVFFKLLGLAASILLLIQSIDANNPLVQKFCGSDSNKNCNAILSSESAKISEELSWSEIGFFYFAGTLLALLFHGGDKSLVQLLAFINLLSLPYTFYSVYYQWRVAKQWCIFCCTVQALLWFEFFAFAPYLFSGIQLPDLQQWGTLFVCMFSPILLWIFIKPHLISTQQMLLLKQELYKFKYDKDLFQKALNAGNKYALPADEDTIIIGNREANNIVTLVSNPFCTHCSKAHRLLDDLLSIRANIKLQLVFVCRSYAKEIDQKVTSHFIALKSAGNETKLKEAINGWYNQKVKNYELWKKDYPVIEPVIEFDAISRQKEWCRIADINSTPTIFINGRRLPQVYQPDDIKYIL